MSTRRGRCPQEGGRRPLKLLPTNWLHKHCNIVNQLLSITQIQILESDYEMIFMPSVGQNFGKISQKRCAYVVSNSGI